VISDASPSWLPGEFVHRRLVIALASLVALCALGGGAELIIWRGGNVYLPIDLLRPTPFATFLVPGLLLALVVGGSSLACAYAQWRRSDLAIDLTLLAGGALTLWLAAELALLRSPHPLHAFFGALGLALCALGIEESLHTAHARTRWVMMVTLAEAAGFLVPVCVGVLTATAGLGETLQAALLVAAGFVEGLALGVGQAWALPYPVDRRRYALLSSLGAGIVWACVMCTRLIAEAPEVPPVATALAGVGTALIGLSAIGTAQWLELRRHAPRAGRWIVWTAIAWIAALPFSFLPAPLVDESTPVATNVVLWSASGLLMALVMAVITWQGVRRLRAAP
jgi:hypothetical protein